MGVVPAVPWGWVGGLVRGAGGLSEVQGCPLRCSLAVAGWRFCERVWDCHLLLLVGCCV